MESPHGKEVTRLNHSQTLQAILDYIDDNITCEISASMIAEKAGYSAYHFSRIFTETIGIPPISYVTWRKLQFALYDLTQGKKVIDAAMEYGFETHAGFTKAFVHWFGFPPSLCYPRINAASPAKADIQKIKNKFYGGNAMHPHIIELTPFAVVGYPSRHAKPNLKSTADAPTFWNTIQLDYGPILTKLYDAFPKSKHCEISMCYDADEATGDFTYMLGRGIDTPEDLANIEPDMTRVDIPGGLYAIFQRLPPQTPISRPPRTPGTKSSCTGCRSRSSSLTTPVPTLSTTTTGTTAGILTASCKSTSASPYASAK